MAESTKVDACEGCGERPATTNSFQERRSACSPAQATWHCRGVSTGGTPGPSSAHPGNAGSPPAAGQGHLGPPCPQNAARERSRVRALRQAFLSLQATLPAVPPGTKLSKLDVLVLATSYIAHLSHALGQGPPLSAPSHPLHGHLLLHPLKKWPMRSSLYTDLWGGPGPDSARAAVASSSHKHSGPGDSRLTAGDSPP